MLDEVLPRFAPERITLRSGESVVLRSFSPKDVESCLWLRAEVYGTPFLASEWNWKFGQACPYPHEVLVAETEGKIVGIQPMIAFPFLAESQTLSALLLLDLMIHPAWRKKGLFTLLVKRVETELLDRFAFFYTFPNKNSLPGFTDKLGWVIPFRPLLMVRPALPRKLKENDSSTLPEPGVRLFKDKAYFDWRYSRPARHYQQISPNAVLAYQKHFGIKAAFGAEFGGSEFLLGLMENSAAPAPLVFLVNPNSPVHHLLKRKGFMPQINKLRRFHLTVKIKPGNQKLLADLARWELCFGDCDTI
jgi:GNAT superfamily N-acetyltransferase